MKTFTNILLLLFIFASISRLYSMNKDTNNLHIYYLKYLHAPRTAFILNIIQEIRNQRASNEIMPFIQSKGNTGLNITANKEDWERIRKIINELDKPQPQIYIIDSFEFKECLKDKNYENMH